MNKKDLLAGIFSIALSAGLGNAYAQEPRPEPPFDDRPPHHEKMERMHHRFADRLKLTDEQKKQAEEIRRTGREKMDAVHKENMQEFEKILTDEQKAELVKIKAERPRFDSRRHRRGERPLPPHHEE